ncbi:PKD domain-containing protein [Brumimicrobium oceani]|uniref:PKD domain-containing protein n=1 Tax=Brumimicrobium oceani TaxID=2100725 RepID=A0A2U2XGC1_9FLAO|nr:PKD domain-containing protein [Brumimicrobium oceani]PWH86846.1 hypothetical protein DIT68_00870 [Brumimicrobium oceani]
MKDNLEKAFKESLEEYEVAYDPKAWDAVNAQMNKNASSTSSIGSALKWLLALLIIGGVSTATYFLLEKETITEISEVTDTNAEIKSDNTAVQQTEPKSKKLITLDSSNEGEDKSVISIENIEETEVDFKENVRSSDKESDAIVVEEKEANVNHQKQTEPILVDKRNESTDAKQYIAGNISSAIVCPGETIEIMNPSSSEKVRFEINSNWVVLQPNKTHVFAPTESVQIDFVNDKNELIESKYIKVHEAVNPDFTFEANIFEKGLPVVIVEAFGDYKSYQWEFDGEIAKPGAIVKHSFFDKGDYSVALKVTDANGCNAFTSKTIRIREKYNLMAMDAFKPNGADFRNRTFMPYSLKERDVRFQMTIVDPVDNGVLFTSTDAENAWDGTDQRTGKMTPSNKTYIWKVQIFNPVPNERPIYAGTVVHN